MSQAIQRGLILLIAAIVIVAGIAVFLGLQNKNLKDQTFTLQSQLEDSRVKQQQAIADAQKFQKDLTDLNKRIADKDKEKAELQNSYDELKRKMDEVSSQMDQAAQERDDWKNRVETIRKERDQLMTKLQNAPTKIIYKDRPVTAAPAAPAVQATPITAPSGKPDDYWASILTQKAQLEIRLNKAQADMDAAAIQVGELRKQNSELLLQIKGLTNDKMDIERRLTNEKSMQSTNFDKDRQDMQRKIKEGEDLASNLSLEVAHARADQKSANDYANKVKDDNGQLQSQVKQLIGTKVALEKTIARLNQEKDDMNKKLSQTEGVIQDRINEIWQIKHTLDQKISQINNSKGKEVELPPIVVNGPGAAKEEQPQVHKIISINEKNNFVILDIGDSQGSSIGRIFKAYRDGAEIAVLEVIQVRRDISAADIKDQKLKLQVGDQIR